jgi:hypothetical protein
MGANLTLSSGVVAGGAGGGGSSPYYAGGAGGVGVLLAAGASLTLSSGTIVGGKGANGGSNIGGAGGAGVYLGGTSVLTTNGTIVGGLGGQYGAGGTGVVVVAAGASVTNGDAGRQAALIEGAIGVFLAGAGTLTNFATIEGTGGVAVQFGSAGGALIAEAGSTFIGAVEGGGGNLDLADGSGTITGLGAGGTLSGAEAMTFSGFGVYTVGGVADWTVVGATVLSPSQTIVDDGELTLSGAVTNAGFLEALHGSLTVDGSVTGAGQARIGNGTLDFAAAFSEDVRFLAGSGVLGLARATHYIGVISGFSQTGADRLDLGDIGFVDAGEATFSGTATGGTLTVTDGTHTASISLNGDYLNTTFVTSSDGHGGINVIAQASKGVVPPHAFITAMAGLGPAVSSHVAPGEAWAAREPLLTSPRVAIA